MKFGLTVAGGIMVVTSAFKMFMLAVNMGLISHPFGWIVIGVAGAIAGIALLIAYWDNIVNAFKTGWNFVKDIWDNMSGFGKTVVTLFAPFIGIPMLIYDNWESISGLLFDIVD